MDARRGGAPARDPLEPLGGAVAPLPAPRGVQPPTLLPPTGTSHAFDPLVTTYATVPYADVNPSVLAGVTYVTMFGIMFADAGHGSLLVLAALAVRFGWWRGSRPLRRVWLFLAGAGAASIVFGVLYGEFFGPTGVIPVVWLAPLEQPGAPAARRRRGRRACCSGRRTPWAR